MSAEPLAPHPRRRPPLSSFVVVPTLICLLLVACEPSGPPADTIFTGEFVTLDTSNPRVEALAVTDGRIVAAGSRSQVERLANDATQRIAIPGLAVPGFAEGHAHPTGVGRMVQGNRLDFYGMSKEEVLAAIAAVVLVTRSGEWITGRAWDEGFWDPPNYPTAADLDPLSSEHPMSFSRLGGHGSWVNSVALELAGITRDTPDPPGGRINRDDSGDATGVLVDNAQSLVSRVGPSDRGRSEADESVLPAGLQQYARWGVTSVHDAGAGLDRIAQYRELLADGELPVRIYAMASTGPTLEHYLAEGPEIGLGDGMLTVRAFKLFMDGALGSRGAELTDPYMDGDDPEERGLLRIDLQGLDEIIAEARAKGFQINPHAIGDRAITRLLDAYERGGVTVEDRFRIEHASVINPTDVARFARLGVIASLQPVFIGEYSRWSETRLGPERVRWVLPTRDLLEAGVVVASGTDYPSSDSGNPIHTLYGLVARKAADGRPAGGWYTEQAIDVDTALRTMSIGPAYAAFQEDDLGQLTVGRYADFTVLSEDPFEIPADSLLRLTVRMTVMGGRITHDASPSAGSGT
jgi:predicted amidohydrolase YtcJ